MKKFEVKANSKSAEFFIKMIDNKKAVKQYVNGTKTITELKEQGVKFAQPVQRSIRTR